MDNVSAIPEIIFSPELNCFCPDFVVVCSKFEKFTE